MKVTAIKLYRIRSGNTGEKGAEVGESQYRGGGWQTNSLIAGLSSMLWLENPCPRTVGQKSGRLRARSWSQSLAGNFGAGSNGGDQGCLRFSTLGGEYYPPALAGIVRMSAKLW